MLIKVTFDKIPRQVYKIYWTRKGWEQRNDHPATTYFQFANGTGLEVIGEHDCQVIDGQIDDFVMMPQKYSANLVVLIWKPLVESNIMESLQEFYPEAIEAFRQLRIDHGHIKPDEFDR